MSTDEIEVHFGRVAVIGTGLIGCSVAALLKGRGVAEEVVGIDIEQSHLQMAKRLGFVDRTFDQAARGVMGAGAVILAVPLDEIFKVMDEIGPDVRPGALLTCTAGSTVRLRTQLVRHVRSAENFVPSYPLVHELKRGPGAASPTLLVDRTCLVSGGDPMPGKAVEQVDALWRRLGLRVERLAPEAFEAAVVGHRFWPEAVVLAARQVAERGAWPDGPSALTAWLEQAGSLAGLDRSHQLYSTRLSALLSEFIDTLEDLQRTLGGGSDEELPGALDSAGEEEEQKS